MSELILLSLNRAEFLALHDAAAKGDEAATAAIAAMWDEYKDVESRLFHL